ncbi:MAG: cytochrome c3 family protein [Thermodesulfobacteriota bacterium]
MIFNDGIRNHALSIAAFLFCAAFSALILPIRGDAVSGQPGGDCGKCHSGNEAKRLALKDIYALISAYEFKHGDVANKCEGCHLRTMVLESLTVKELAGSEFQKKAFFFFDGLSISQWYVIELVFKGYSGGNVTARFRFKPADVALMSIEAGGTAAPVVKNVRVSEVRRAVFIEALVKWETEEPSAGFIEYGAGGVYSEKAFFEKTFETRHEAKLPGLKTGDYRFRIVSRDVYGLTSVSGDYRLNPSELKVQEKAAKVIGSASVNPSPLLTKGPVARLFRLDPTGDVYVEVLAASPVRTFLRLTEQAEFGSHGAGLGTARYSRIEACVACHPQSASHPVGVRSSGADVRVPRNMPTIEGGLITCATCHEPHGGNSEYFMRFEDDEGLCARCHGKKKFF